MNYEKIKEKYPKAYEKCRDWLSEYKGSDFGHVFYNDRDLYDFFDMHLISISIPPTTPFRKFNGYINIYKEMKEVNGVGFCNDVWIDKEFDTRTEAETEAFEVAFSILENKLTEKVK